MNGITILIWVTIAIIAIIAIILVKLHYRGKELENDEGSILEDAESLTKVFSSGKSMLSKDNDDNSNNPTNLNQSKPKSLKSENSSTSNVYYEEPAIYEVDNTTYENIEYESQNQVLVDYGTTVEKFQEPIKQSQMDIMSQNNDPKPEKHELKDLFTIDELIKESKRKDSEREKEAYKNDSEDKELAELKESIKQKQEEKNIEEIIDDIPEETIQDILNETEEETTAETITESAEEETITETITESTEEETIAEVINEPVSEETKSDSVPETVESSESEESKIEAPTVTSQDIEEAITTASEESKEEVESISESAGITDALLNDNEKEEIKEPNLKTPTKIKEDYKFGEDLKDEKVFGEYDSDLDYRKDLDKITNTIKGSKIFKNVKEKLTFEEPEEEEVIEEEFIRNVNEYEEDFAPIINETHADYATYEEYHKHDFEEPIVPEETPKAFDVIQTTPEPQPEIKESRIAPIKEKPSRDNIKIKLNNNEVVLKKGDEIIYNHQGETYSSQVYAINGNDISVKYRRKNIVIKPSDVKKVY
ncbi:ATPase [Methanobrevibacter sp.]|uniref:ATPase n=1 Tax=Methanobrevibacter sp. TaxID=66852 RepID=UPI0025D754B5|nr:ATPase [Methanobrevibacter sp.]MEE0941696.1 ATPase [Methanobrevibacter sp.]